MQYMFRSASAFNRDIDGWTVSDVKTMIAMFQQVRSMFHHAADCKR